MEGLAELVGECRLAGRIRSAYLAPVSGTPKAGPGPTPLDRADAADPTVRRTEPGLPHRAGLGGLAKDDHAAAPAAAQAQAPTADGGGPSLVELLADRLRGGSGAWVPAPLEPHQGGGSRPPSPQQQHLPQPRQPPSPLHERTQASSDPPLSAAAASASTQHRLALSSAPLPSHPMRPPPPTHTTPPSHTLRVVHLGR